MNRGFVAGGLIAAALAWTAGAPRAQTAGTAICEREGRFTQESAEECRRGGGHPRGAAEAGPGLRLGWARLEGARGVVTTLTLACANRSQLLELARRPRPAAQALERGECRLLQPALRFRVRESAPGIVRIELDGGGSLWVLTDAVPAPTPETTASGAFETDTGRAAQPATGDSGGPESCPAPPPEQRGSPIASVQIARWEPFLGGSGAHHPDDDGAGLDRCVRARVCFRGSGSRLVDASDFEADFASGAVRRGEHFLGDGVRLNDGEFASGIVCFGGALHDPIVALRLR